jgi:hypothetical protein
MKNKKMLQKNWVTFGISIATLLLFVATIYYPGGSYLDADSTGFNWQHNYFSNLFTPKAVNGLDNSAQPWAIIGMVFLTISLGGFFVRFSNKMAEKSTTNVIKYSGLAAMIATFFTITPLHDLMIRISCVFTMICYFYITVFVFKSKLTFLKILSFICLLMLYATAYIYFTSSYLEILPIMQKVSFLVNIIWVLCLEYFTTKADFEGFIKKRRI